MWWATYVVAALLGAVGNHLGRAEDLPTIRAAALTCAVADLLWIAAAAQVVPIVRALTARQRARADRSPLSHGFRATPQY